MLAAFNQPAEINSINAPTCAGAQNCPHSQVLPTICKWTSVRFHLFAQALAERSAVYWYDDALAAPLRWHYNLPYYLGLGMPAAVVEWAMHVAVSEHPGHVFFETTTGDEAKSEPPDDR